MEKLKHFFWHCSGADIKILEKHSSESVKYVGIGATIFFTGVFAAIAASYAVFTIFDNLYISLAFGILWGLMIFNLDRYIVSSMRKHKKRSRELLMATPRLILALFISIVIAKPLELKIFEKEINSELLVMQLEAKEKLADSVARPFNEKYATIDQQIATLKNEVLVKERKRDTLLQIAQKEADGTGGTMQRNAGPIYKIKKADADQASLELTQLRAINEAQISKLIAQKDSLEIKKAEAITSIEEVTLNGLASRLEGLSRITDKSFSIALASIFITLLFIAIETAPVLVKLMSPEGPYDFELRCIIHKHKANQYDNMARVNNALKQKEGLNETEREYLDDNLDLSLNDT